MMDEETTLPFDSGYWKTVKETRDCIQREAQERKRAIPLRTTVILSSDEYGNEEFKYDTDEELLAGVVRLLDKQKSNG